MGSKSRPSIDYDVLLHELSLRNWRAALLDGDFRRARQSAERLARSHEGFWRWLGWSHIAVAAASEGRVEETLAALETSAHSYPEARNLVARSRETKAHVLLEIGAPDLALEALRGVDDSPACLYWRALSLARLGRSPEAEAIARDLDGARGPLAALADHVRSELSLDESAPERIALLDRSLSRLSAAALWTPVIPIRFALADALQGAGRKDEALAGFGAVVAERETLLHWPIPYVRGLYRMGSLSERREDAQRWMARFLDHWRYGDLDRPCVEDAKRRARIKE